MWFMLTWEISGISENPLKGERDAMLGISGMPLNGLLTIGESDVDGADIEESEAKGSEIHEDDATWALSGISGIEQV